MTQTEPITPIAVEALVLPLHHVTSVINMN